MATRSAATGNKKTDREKGAQTTFGASLSRNDRVMLTVGSEDEDCIRIGVYRAGVVFPERLGYVMLPIRLAGGFSSELAGFLEDYGQRKNKGAAE